MRTFYKEVKNQIGTQGTWIALTLSIAAVTSHEPQLLLTSLNTTELHDVGKMAFAGEYLI